LHHFASRFQINLLCVSVLCVLSVSLISSEAVSPVRIVLTLPCSRYIVFPVYVMITSLRRCPLTRLATSLLRCFPNTVCFNQKCSFNIPTVLRYLLFLFLQRLTHSAGRAGKRAQPSSSSPPPRKAKQSKAKQNKTSPETPITKSIKHHTSHHIHNRHNFQIPSSIPSFPKILAHVLTRPMRGTK
jgi:hypothetical protein